MKCYWKVDETAIEEFDSFDEAVSKLAELKRTQIHYTFPVGEQMVTVETADIGIETE